MMRNMLEKLSTLACRWKPQIQYGIAVAVVLIEAVYIRAGFWHGMFLMGALVLAGQAGVERGRRQQQGKGLQKLADTLQAIAQNEHKHRSGEAP